MHGHSGHTALEAIAVVFGIVGGFAGIPAAIVYATGKKS